jgi:hypothetical protein
MNRVFFMIPHAPIRHYQKSDLVTLGQWALATGRGWLERAVHRALTEEGVGHA